MTLHFKIVTGYGKEDYIPIDESEYAKAVKAQVNKSVFLSKVRGSITGSDIKRIEPNWEAEEKVYNPSGEDIIPQAKKQEYETFLETTHTNLELEYKTGRPQLGQSTKLLK